MTTDPVTSAMNRLMLPAPHARETAERNYQWLVGTLKDPFNAEENYTQLCNEIKRLKQEQE